MPNYLIAVGGTGQHVALALADLIALGHEVMELPMANIILVDADSAGDRPPGNEQSHTESAWQEAEKQLRRIDRYGDSFAMSPLPTDTPHKDMEEFINTQSRVTGASEALLLKRQRDIALEHGFYAEPRVGALVAEWLFEGVTAARLRLTNMKRIFDIAADPANRIAVVGSGVGGTGAGFAPTLLRRLLSQGDARARVMALMATEWFQLSGQGNTRLAEVVQRANVNSALWHSTRKREHLTTVLWGHPSLVNASREDFQESAGQVRKKNLTLPYYAAAVAQRFFAGLLDQYDGKLLAIAAASEGNRVALAPDFPVGEGVSIGDLIARNREAVSRLNLAIEYLRQPYQGHVLSSWLSGYIGNLWPRDRKKRDELTSRLQAVRDAKTRALENIGHSDEKLRSEITQAVGLSNLRDWAGNDAVRSVGDLWRVKPLAERKIKIDSYTPKLLLRDTVKIATAVNIGQTLELSLPTIQSLISLSQVDVSKVPASDAVELAIGEYLETWNNWGDETRRTDKTRVADEFSLTAQFKTVSANEGDRPLEWVRRWMLLSSLVMSRKVSIGETSELAPFVPGETIAFHGMTIGVLSKGLVCVPLINEWWNNEAVVSEMVQAGQSLYELSAWIGRLAILAACRRDEAPLWLRFMRSICPPAVVRAQRGNRTLPVTWDTGTVNLPIPGSSGAKDLDRWTAEELGVFTTDPPQNPSTEVVRAIQEIGGSTLALKNATGESEAIVIFEGLDGEAKKYILGDLIVDKANHVAWILDDRAIIRSIEEEVLTPTIAVFKNVTRRVIATPVQSKYLQWFVDGGPARCETRDENGAIVASIQINGRLLLRKTYPPSKIRNAETALLLAWPRKTLGEAPPLTVLISDEKSSQRVTSGTITFQTAAGWSVSTRLLRSLQPYYIDPAPGAVHALSVEVAGEESGFLSVKTARAVQLPAEEQAWSVDFGTSSTVVAVLKGSETTVIDFFAAPTGASNSDASIEIWTGDDLDHDQWYGTRRIRQGLGSFDSKKRVPSSLSMMVPMTKPTEQLTDSDLRFGRDILLTQDDWPSASSNDYVIDIKWDRNAAFRKQFLRYHLEQAIASAISSGLVISAHANMLFTLPIRQAARLKQFKTEVESVLAQVSRSTSLTIRPSYAFESQVIAPVGLPMEGVAAAIVADLGGGTLDLFGRRFSGDGQADLFDSAVIGGHLLVDHLAGGMSPEVRQGFRLSQYGSIDRHAPAAIEYFRFLMRYILLWAESACEHWQLEPQERKTIAIQALGLGWRLPGSPEHRLADRLTETAREIDINIEFIGYRNELIPDDPKETLARLAVNYIHRADEIDPKAPPLIHGLDVQIGQNRQMLSHSQQLKSLPNDLAIVQISDDSRLARLLKGETRALINEIRVDAEARLKKVSKGLGRQDGALNKEQGVWVTSPLSVFAETYVERKLLAENR